MGYNSAGEAGTHLCAQVHARQGFTDADHGLKLTRGGGNTAILHSKGSAQRTQCPSGSYLGQYHSCTVSMCPVVHQQVSMERVPGSAAHTKLLSSSRTKASTAPCLFVAALPPEVLVALNQARLSGRGEGGRHASTSVRHKLPQQLWRVGLQDKATASAACAKAWAHQQVFTVGGVCMCQAT